MIVPTLHQHLDSPFEIGAIIGTGWWHGFRELQQ